MSQGVAQAYRCGLLARSLRPLSRLRSFAARPAADRFLLLESAIWVTLVRTALWLLPFRTLQGLTRRATRTLSKHGSRRGVEPSRLSWGIRAASRLVPRATCLTQALALQLSMARRGVASEVTIGVARDPHKGFIAHAWIEHCGRVLIGGDVAIYSQLLRLAERRQ